MQTVKLIATMNTDIIQKYDMLPKGSRVLCAVSGGADSMCLTHYLYENRCLFGIEVVAAHYEHGLRGEESMRDCRFVEEYCHDRGICLYIGHGDVKAYAQENGLGTEEAARILRYDFLESCAKEHGCDRIATAHNADDNAETVIFNLTRGTGTAGLRGIPPVRGNIVRPLLGATRDEIEEYLRQNGIDHVEDSSNASDDYTRNVIRHSVMPVLRGINGGFSAGVGRTSELLRRDEDCLSQLACSFIDECFDDESIDCRSLLSQPEAVSSRVIRTLAGSGLSMEHIDAVLRFASGTELAYLDLPGIRLRREQGRLYFGTTEPRRIEERRIAFPGVTLIPEAQLVIKCEKGKYTEEVNNKFNTFCFRCESICGGIICTARKPGDEYRPRGRNCTKTLKSLFTQAKLTQNERELTPVVRDDMGILAVYGFGADERGTPSLGDDVIIIKMENNITGR